MEIFLLGLMIGVIVGLFTALGLVAYFIGGY